MSFYDFMMSFTGEDSPRGDLARDMRDDNNTGGEIAQLHNRDDLRNYLHCRSNGWRELLHTFAGCWASYRKSA